MRSSIPRTVDQLFDLFIERGAALYLGEAVTQLEHAEQCAARAVAEGASDSLVLAAFLHDVGHLVFDDDAGGADDGHEAAGSVLVGRVLGEEIAAPIRLHVAAKRHLCGCDPTYVQRLSPTSLASLAAQGGPFEQAEQARFLAEAFAQDALLLRRWDDLGKLPRGAGIDLEAIRGLAHARSAR